MHLRVEGFRHETPVHVEEAEDVVKYPLFSVSYPLPRVDSMSYMTLSEPWA